MSRYKTLGGMLAVDDTQQNQQSFRPVPPNRQMSSNQIVAPSLSYTNMLLNPDGSVLTKDHIRELRERQGFCTTCQGEPIKLYEIRKSKLNPLWKAKEQISVMHESYNGVCLRCNPQMDPFKAQRRTSLQFSLSGKGNGSIRSLKSQFKTPDGSLQNSLRSFSMSREGSLRSVETLTKEIDVSFLRNKQERTTSRDVLPHALSPTLPPDLAGFDVSRDPRFNSSFTSHELTESNDSGEFSSDNVESSPEGQSQESNFATRLAAMKAKASKDWDEFSMPDFSQGSSDTFKSHRKKMITRSPKERRRQSGTRLSTTKRNSLIGIEENSLGEMQRSTQSITNDTNKDNNTEEDDFFEYSFAEDDSDPKPASKKVAKDKSEKSKKKKKEKKSKVKDRLSKDSGSSFAASWPETFDEHPIPMRPTDANGFNKSDLFGQSDLFDSALLESGDEIPSRPMNPTGKSNTYFDPWSNASYDFNKSNESMDMTTLNFGASRSERYQDSQEFNSPPRDDETGGPDIGMSNQDFLMRSAPNNSPPQSVKEAQHILPDDEEVEVITRKNPEEPLDRDKLAEIDALLKDVAAAGSVEFLTELLVNTMRSHQENTEIQELCLSYIWDLSKFNDVNKSAIMSAGLPEDIIKAMKDFKQSLKVQECACGALWSLSVNQFNRTELVRLGAVSRIFRALEIHLKMEGFVETAFGALRTLSPDPEVRATIGQLLGAQRVCRAMGLHRQSTSIQRDGCAFLSNVAVDMDNQVVSIVSYEELEAVIRAMGDHLRHEAVLASACFALKNYTYEEKNLRAVRQFEDVCSLLEDASKYSSSLECRNDAAETLDRIRMLQTEDETLEEIVYSSLFEMQAMSAAQSAEESVMSVIDILSEYEWSIKLLCYCLDTLSELSKQSEEHMVLVTQHLALQAILNAMERQKMNAKVQKKGCDLLKLMANHSIQSRSTICDVNGTNVVLIAMRKHRGVEPVQMAAFGALKALSDDPRCAREVARIGGLTRIRDAYQEGSIRESGRDDRSMRSLSLHRSCASIQAMDHYKSFASIRSMGDSTPDVTQPRMAL